jgi:hypothetical protein
MNPMRFNLAGVFAASQTIVCFTRRNRGVKKQSSVVTTFTKALLLPLMLISTISHAVSVTIDPANYSGLWDLDLSGNFTSGQQTLNLVPGRHTIRPGTVGQIHFDVDAAGNVVPANSDYNVSLIGSQNSLQLQTLPVTIDVGLYAGKWQIGRVRDAASGSEVVNLVPSNTAGGGTHYRFAIGIGTSAFFVRLAGDGSLNIGNLDAAVGNTNHLQFTNATVFVEDQDDTGIDWFIREVTDPGTGDHEIVHVPGIQYFLQGNGGSGFYTVAEPCAINPPTVDLNGAVFNLSCGLPDQDDDGVPDSNDNCPAVANPDQIDIDGDFLGDSCDLDDDNDSIADVIDNCPLIPNTNQDDQDNDGQGDACDGDSDGDNVADNDDLCLFTSTGVVVDSDGCSGVQRIAMSCVRSQFVNHGKYVSCVAHAANDAVTYGLINPSEKSQFIKAAAKSK